jgi:hypothetical protein
MPRTRPTRPRPRLATFVLAALLAAACGESTAPMQAQNAPRELAFDVTIPEPGEATHVKMDGAAVVVTHFRWRDADGPRERVRVVPTAAQWAAFWTAAEAAGVRQWTGDYEAEGVQDGVGWSLRLAGEGVAIDSHGTNAYPDRHGQEHEMQVTADFRAFLDALGTLTGWEF